MKTALGAWWLVGLLSLTAGASYLSRVNLSIAAVLVMKEFNLTQALMGRAFSAFLLGYALFQVPSGMLADRRGARRVLAVATLSWVVVTALLASIGWGPLALSADAAFAVMLAFRFLLGVCEAPTFPAAGQAVSRWLPAARQGRANGLVIAAIGAGSAIAPPLVSFVMVRWGWRVALLVSALPALTAGVSWLALREHHAPAAIAPPGDPNAVRGRLATRSFALLTASYTLQGYVGYIFVFWFYLYLVQVRHFDVLQGAWVSMLPWLLSIVSIPLGGIISDRLVESRLGLTWGRRIVPMVGYTGSGLFLALGAHTANGSVAAVSLAISTALVLCVEGPTWATMMEVAGARSGTGGGVLNMGSNAGGLVSPVLTPVLASAMGWENALHVGAAVAIVAGLLWFGIKPAAERVGAP